MIEGQAEMKFDHIGIVVDDLAEGRRILTSTLGIECWTEVFEEPGIGVLAQFGAGPNGPCYELLSPLGDNSPVSGALKRRMNVLNRVAYLVKDIHSSASALLELGYLPVVEAKPAVAFGGNLVQFFQSPLCFLIELIEAQEHKHSFLASATPHE